MKKLILLVGPPGSGKSTYAKYDYPDYTYINQDSQGKEGHYNLFQQALKDNKNIIVDRMNFDHQQRNRYLLPKHAGYTTEIIVLHESYDTCMKRMLARKGHETVKSEENAKKALHFFFTHYDRVENYEADIVTRIYPTKDKPKAIICDLDGTLCNIENDIRKLPSLTDFKVIGQLIQDENHGLKHPGAVFPYLLKRQAALDKYILKYLRPTGNMLKSLE